MNFRLSIVLYFFSFFVYAQSVSFVDIENSYKLRNDTITKYSNKLSRLPYQENSSKPKVVSKFHEICIKRGEYFKALHEDNQLMGQGELVEFVQSLTDYLVSKNTNLLYSHYKVFILRNSSVNASNLGQGILLINIGLLAQVNSIEQLAFVIAHELSHDIQQHVKTLTYSTALAITDNTYKQEMRSASRQTYGGYTTMQNVQYKLMAHMNLHSRNNEISADSLGVIICNNAGIDKKHAIELLKILDNSNEFIFQDTLNLVQLFSSADLQLTDENLKNPDVHSAWSAIEGLYKLPDSLKTHPDCSTRIFIIEDMVDLKTENLKSSDGLNELNKSWLKMRTKISNEFIHTLIEENYISLAQYYINCLISRGQATPFLYTLNAYCLYDYAKAIKTHRFGDKTEFPDLKLPAGYNQFLEFLHAQNSTKFKKMANAILKYQVPASEKSELVNFTLEFGYHLETGNFTSSSIKPENFKNYFYSKKIKELIINK